MTTFGFLAVCFIAWTALTGVNGKCVSTYRCDDMQDGGFGVDNGIDQPFDKPSIHLDGSTTSGLVPSVSNRALDYWDTNSSNSFITGGMKYSNGDITVPVTGIYFVYCQLYYRKSNEGARHRIYLNGITRVAEAGNHIQDTEGSFYTGVSLKLNSGDNLSCRLRFDTNLWVGTYHSFFGAFLQ